MKALANLSFVILIFISLSAFGLIPDRRPDTVSTKSGYLFIPVFGNVPGIGTAYGAGFLSANAFNSRATLAMAAVYGSVGAAILDLSNLYIGDHLSFEFTSYATKLSYEIFDRGDLSDKNLYSSPLAYEYGGQGIITLKFWEKRFQLYGHLGPSRIQSYQISDQQGDTFNNADNFYFNTMSSTVGAELDLTDSSVDPRKGFRLEADRDQQLNFDGLHSQFYVFNISPTAFIPIGKHSLVFNYFRSSAFVFQQSNLTPTQLQAAMSLNCASNTNANCQTIENSRVQERVLNNYYGTAAPLGGADRMRGFSQNRFHGSQTQFYGSEMRFNLTEEGKPFNFGFIEGVRSNIQLAFFYELGATSDPPLPVEEAPVKTDYGAGFRFIFSGVVLRAELGLSSDGTAFTFFFGYPWQGSVL
jgi:hypothetical protein